MKDGGLDKTEPEVEALSQADLGTAPEGNVWMKLDRRLLPVCTSFFLLAFLNRTNIANARVAGLQTSLAMSNYQYTVALTLTYVALVVAEFPATLILKQVGPDLMLPTMVTAWGVVAALQGVVHNVSGLLACRFFLGLMEGGIFPGIVLYLSSFYPRKRLQIRIATFFGASSLSGAFSGLLAAAIDRMSGRGGKPGWAWIFILEGAASIAFGLVSFFLLPRSPEKARFLTEMEREYVIYSLKHAGAVSEDDERDNFRWNEIVGAAKSPHIWLLSVAFFFNGAILFGLALFEPTIVAGLGYRGNHAQLMSVPPFAVAFVRKYPTMSTVTSAHLWRGYTAIFFSLLEMVGFSMFYASTSSHIRYASLFFSIIGAYCQAPSMIAWMANNSAPHTRRATAVAMSFLMVDGGGIFGTWLLGTLSAAPNYRSATITFISMSIGTVVFAAGNLMYLRRENGLKAERRQRMRREDEPAGVGDRSAWFIYSL